MDENSGISSIPVKKLLGIDKEQDNVLGFTVISGSKGLNKKIISEEINRPGLPLAGFFDCFASNRIQIFGRGEVAYIIKLVKEGRTKTIDRFFSFDIPLCIVTHDSALPDYIINKSNDQSIPIFRTKLTSRRLIALMSTILADVFAPFVTIHGNFMSIYNVGVLITGKSGIGKSESVLGLIERGHKFICDDIVKIQKIRTAHGFELKGEPNFNYGPYLEIRGIGIINVSQYFGEGRILKSEKLDIIIDLHEWEGSYNYDRLGIDEKYDNILGIDIPRKEIPVSPGRNIPLLIEVAAYREVMRKIGINSAQELDQKIQKFMKKEKEVV
jgi:HPr kinase/phosphorylase